MEYLVTQASSFAPHVDKLILMIFAVVTVWFVIGQYVFFSFLFRYRRSKHPAAAYISGETKEETKWIHISHYAVIACDLVIIVFAMMTWYHVKQNLPKADSTIRVIGQQWAWKFVVPGKNNQLDTTDDITMMDELHVEVNKIYHFKLEAKDVVHSFSIPVFRLEQDAIPGRVITGWFQPTKVGEYDIQCTQMCGLGHGIMQGRVFVETPSEHATWIEQHSNKALATATQK